MRKEHTDKAGAWLNSPAGDAIKQMLNNSTLEPSDDAADGRRYAPLRKSYDSAIKKIQKRKK